MPNKFTNLKEFQVKVWHERSGTTTNLTMYGQNQYLIQEKLELEYEDDNSWVFVSATEVDIQR